MLVAHRGGGAPNLTAEQVKKGICRVSYVCFAEFSTCEAVEIRERGALLEAGTDLRSGGLGPWCRGGIGIK